MSFWLYLSAPLTAPTGIDPAPHEQMLDASDEALADAEIAFEQMIDDYNKAWARRKPVPDEQTIDDIDEALAGGDAFLDEQIETFDYKAPAGVDPVLFRQMFTASHMVADRVTRCFAGSAWLRRRFPAGSFLQVYLLTTDDASVGVEILTTESGPDRDNGPQGIHCNVRIPMSWLAERADALLGLRLFQVVLHVLHVIGEHYGIGMPAAIGPGADRGDPKVWDPFGPPPALPSYADINAHLERLA
ncbi:MAG TPA: hypothetical protein VF657_09460, partial [Actinoplanes sp.]